MVKKSLCFADEGDLQVRNSGRWACMPMSEIAGIARKESAVHTVGLSDTYGTTVTISPKSGYRALWSLWCSVEFGGVFGVGETVTARIIAYRSDGTQQALEIPALAVGVVNLEAAEMYTLFKDNTYLTAWAFRAKTDQAGTTATVTFNTVARNLL